MKIAISDKGGVGKTILVSLVSRPFAIDKLAQEIDLHNIAIAASKVRSQSEKEFLPFSLPSFEFPGLIWSE